MYQTSEIVNNKCTKMSKFARKIYELILRMNRRIRGGYWTAVIQLLGGTVGKGLRASRGLTFQYPPHNGISIGNNVSLGVNVVIDVPIHAKLEIGERVKISLGSVISANRKIKVGNDVLIGEFASIRDADHGMSDVDKTISSQELVSAAISIGSDVWIGRGVAILKGSCIESGSVVGANAVVTRHIAGKSIYVGIPAKKIKDR